MTKQKTIYIDKKSTNTKVIDFTNKNQYLKLTNAELLGYSRDAVSFCSKTYNESFFIQKAFNLLDVFELILTNIDNNDTHQENLHYLKDLNFLKDFISRHETAGNIDSFDFLKLYTFFTTIPSFKFSYEKAQEEDMLQYYHHLGYLSFLFSYPFNHFNIDIKTNILPLNYLKNINNNLEIILPVSHSGRMIEFIFNREFNIA
jgi:hypothetical protein